jgi:predicted RNA-binding protein YlqC (UPF0109 family)
MRHFLDYVLHQLVDHPEDVDIHESTGEKVITFHVACHPEDVGKVIGRNGRTISSIRSLLTAAASKTDTRVVLDVVPTSS